MKIYAERYNEEQKDYVCAIDTPWLINFCYLHGKLQDENGFDLIYAKNEEDWTMLQKLDHDVFDVSVVYPDGSKHKGKFFLWTSGGRQHGLVVDPDDTKYLRDARCKYVAQMMHI